MLASLVFPPLPSKASHADRESNHSLRQAKSKQVVVNARVSSTQEREREGNAPADPGHRSFREPLAPAWFTSGSRQQAHPNAHKAGNG
jgi:hypothetical protein